MPPPESTPEAEADGDGEAERPLEPAQRERHVEDALREVDIAEKSIERTLEAKRQGKPPPDQPPPAPGQQAGRGACDTACNALGSMERSATYVCRLTGEGDPRCRTAQERARAARTKIEKAACNCAQPVARRETGSRG
jgi:hypothetical protein